MSVKWPEVKLGDVLTRADSWINTSPEIPYKEVTVKLWGRGVVLRREVPGAEIVGQRRLKVRRNQFILSRIDARNGAIGLVPDDLDGAIVTNDFPAFNVREDRLLPEFLGWLSKTAGFVESCRHASEGTTNRVRLKEDKFLRLTIPLPPLPEQSRIVTKIEQIASRREETRMLQSEIARMADDLMVAQELRIWSSKAMIRALPLCAVTKFLARGKQSQQGVSGHTLVKTQHVQQGRYLSSNMRLDPIAAVKVREEAFLQDGDILIACSAAGCLGRVARYSGNGEAASTDTHVAIARPVPNVIDGDYLYAYLKGAQGQLQLCSRERGDWKREKIGFRLTELNVNDLRKVPVPLPALSEQRRIVADLEALQKQVDLMKTLRVRTATEINALLPSILNRAFLGQL